MGHGSYSEEAHASITRNNSAAPVAAVFSQRQVHPALTPTGLGIRESRDSLDHPNSLAITFAVDVTGSMGEIPATLARDTLPSFMSTLIGLGVADPQIQFVAIGDARMGDQGPLQVGQFESTAELINRDLTRLWLEGRGGGNDRESYELALYLAAYHTATDCFDRRGRKGYLFITGDEAPYDMLAAQDTAEVGLPGSPPIHTLASLVTQARKRWNIYFMIPDPHRAERIPRFGGASVRDRWVAALGEGSVVTLPNHICMAEAAARIVARGEGCSVTLPSYLAHVTLPPASVDEGAAFLASLFG